MGKRKKESAESKNEDGNKEEKTDDMRSQMLAIVGRARFDGYCKEEVDGWVEGINITNILWGENLPLFGVSVMLESTMLCY